MGSNPGMQAPRYRIAGSEIASDARDASPPGTAELGCRSLGALRVGPHRGSESSWVEVAGDDLVRIRLRGGGIHWRRVDDLLETHGETTRDGTAWTIQPTPPTHTRGMVTKTIEVLEFFGIDLVGTSVRALCTKFENRSVDRDDGLYRCVRGSTKLESGHLPSGPQPLLLFLHGTFSCFRQAYGPFWKSREGRALAERYGDRTLAFEHRTMTSSPLSNALRLVEQLPAGARLHVVSHSRGGLVGDLLTLADSNLAEIEADELEVLLGLEGRGHLSALHARLKEKDIRVERFVRVACPSRGTTFVSRRLDRWLSNVSFVLGWLGLPSLVEEGCDLFLAILKERTDPGTLPGLQAMMPDSGLVRLLNHPKLTTTADLSVVAGDTDGSLLGGGLMWVVDQFYGGDSDLVVNTASMYGGIRRPEGRARFRLDKGAGVTHLSYFVRADSVRWLLDGLAREDGDAAGFLAMHTLPPSEPIARGRAVALSDAEVNRPLVVLLPGIMGSALNVGGEPVWLNYKALFLGGLSRLAVDAEGVEVAGAIEAYYGDLARFLGRSHRVEVFAYDWRRSIVDSAESLANALEPWVEQCEANGQPLRFMAHSMGGLVVRALIGDEGRGAQLWERICKLPGSRLVMLGTPNRGSHEVLRWLTGHNPTQEKLAWLDAPNSEREIIDIVNRLPGLLELLPWTEGDSPFHQENTWVEIKRSLGATWTTARGAALALAAETGRRLSRSPVDGEHMVYVAGCQPETVSGYRLKSRWWPMDYLMRLEFVGTSRGDGTVTWASGVLPGVRTYYVADTEHSELCSQTRVFDAYEEILLGGRTSALPSLPPASRSAAEDFVLTPERAEHLPTPREVVNFGFGIASNRGVPTGALPPVQVELTHGDLAYARFPVLVGHYLGDAIVSAEQALDRRLDGALSERASLDMYPGELGTHAVFFNRREGGRPRGALVVGLGRIGQVAPGELTRGVRDVLLEFALQRLYRADGGTLSVSSVLVGSGAGGLSVRSSLEAILTGAMGANQKLRDAGLIDKVQIGRVEFLELFQDLGLNAATALDALADSGPLGEQMDWRPRILREGEGGRVRLSFEEASEGWHRLSVQEKQGRLHFIATAGRARLEELSVGGQLERAEAFVRLASASSAATPDVAKVLFELLLPNRLKAVPPRGRNMVVVVDRRTARLPWELLEDRWGRGGIPPAVEAGLVRQLATPRFRSEPMHTLEQTALVIGEPALSEGSKYPPLPGARNEAHRVAEALWHAGFDTRAEVGAGELAIVGALHAGAWRVLHLAGHGVCEETKEGLRTGMVIGSDARLLTPADVAQMRWVPELVFVNCCHLGSVDGAGSRGQLAAHFAEQFIEMGVRAVVAAGWAVDDEAALEFAETFYRSLLGGHDFGTSVMAAREATWRKFAYSNTWGAYQCYGDPGYRLQYRAMSASSRAERHFYTPAEVVCAIENLRAEVRMSSRGPGERPSAEDMAGRLRALEQQLEAEPWLGWAQRPDVLEALGLTWAGVYDLDRAADYLQKIVDMGAGCATHPVREHLANVLARRAVKVWRSGGRTEELGRQAKNVIDEQIERILALSTPESASTLGSLYKRRAQLSAGDELKQSLQSMERAYWRALRTADHSRGATYPFTNWATAMCLLIHLGGVADESDAETNFDVRRGWLAQVQAERRRAEARAESVPSFFTAVGVPDCMLVSKLLPAAVEPLPEDGCGPESVAILYRRAFERGASWRDHASVVEHVEFLLDVAADIDALDGEWLGRLRAALDSEAEGGQG